MHRLSVPVSFSFDITVIVIAQLSSHREYFVDVSSQEPILPSVVLLQQITLHFMSELADFEGILLSLCSFAITRVSTC